MSGKHRKRSRDKEDDYSRDRNRSGRDSLRRKDRDRDYRDRDRSRERSHRDRDRDRDRERDRRSNRDRDRERDRNHDRKSLRRHRSRSRSSSGSPARRRKDTRRRRNSRSSSSRSPPRYSRHPEPRGGSGAPARRSPKRKDSGSFRFDSPPREGEIPQLKLDTAQLNTLSGVPLPQTANGQVNVIQSIQAMSMAQTAKIDRKLYVGNLPPGITQQLLMNIINDAMIRLEVITEPGNPVISTWISTDGHYAFVEFRNAEEANLGFRLHGMKISGSEIKIGRPRAYEGTMDAIKLPNGALADSATGEEEAKGEGAVTRTKEEEEQANLVKSMEEFKVKEYFELSLPSRFLRIDNIARFENTQDLDDFKNLFSDVWDKASEYGTVLAVKIPRPIFVDRTEQNKQEDLLKAQKEAEEEEKKALADPKFVKKSERRKARLKASKDGANQADYNELHPLQDKRNYEWPEGFGAAFVEFEEMHEAIAARKALHLLKYGQDTKKTKAECIECSFLTEERFTSNLFSRDLTHKVNDLALVFVEILAIEETPFAHE